MDGSSKTLPNFNTIGRSLLIKFKFRVEDQKPAAYLKKCITALRDYLVNEVADRDFVGVRIQYTGNVQDNLIGISFRRSDHMKTDSIWALLSKVIQSNATFGLADRLEVHLDNVKIAVVTGNWLRRLKGGH